MKAIFLVLITMFLSHQDFSVAMHLMNQRLMIFIKMNGDMCFLATRLFVVAKVDPLTPLLV